MKVTFKSLADRYASNKLAPIKKQKPQKHQNMTISKPERTPAQHRVTEQDRRNAEARRKIEELEERIRLEREYGEIK